jgi:hypothetical protein
LTGTGARAVHWLSFVVALTVVGVVALALIFFSVHKIRPQTFEISATLTRWASVQMKMKLSDADRLAGVDLGLGDQEGQIPGQSIPQNRALGDPARSAMCSDDQ